MLVTMRHKGLSYGLDEMDCPLVKNKQESQMAYGTADEALLI